LGGTVLFASGFNPGIAVAGTHYLVRQMLHILLSILVIESATNKSLGCVQGIFRVLYGLDIIFKNKREKKGEA
jgi:hypothetical protein